MQGPEMGNRLPLAHSGIQPPQLAAGAPPDGMMQGHWKAPMVKFT